LEINLTGIVIIVGNYGSGKTEVAINLSVNQRRVGVDVKLGDLDLVNPYFRTREAVDTLSPLGIEVVLPPAKYLQADLPILTPAVKGMISKPSPLTILDVGGDDVGATVLSSLTDVFQKQAYRMLQVINPFRPFTDSLDGCLKIKDEIEKASRLNINGLIGNANLIDDTSPEVIYEGYEFIKNFSEHTRLPLEFITIDSELLSEIDLNNFSCPVLPIERQLVPPWKQAVKLGPKNFILH